MRYVVKTGWVEDDTSYYDKSPISSLTVDDQKVTFTGLVDVNDNPICRVQAPIGFGRDEEW